MQLVDTSIIMGGKAPNVANALAGGLQSGISLRDAQYTGQFRNALAAHGAGAVAGDQTARNALAGFDPTMVQGLFQTDLAMDQTRLGMQETQQRMRIMGEQEARAAATALREAGEAASAQDMANLERALKAGASAQNEQEFDATMTALGATEFIGQFGNREMLMNMQRDLDDVYADTFGRQWTSIVSGEQAEALGLPPGAYNYTEGPDGASASAIGGGGTTINNNMGGADAVWGDAPTGTVWLRDQNGQVITQPDASGRGVVPVSAPIPGGSLQAEQDAAAAEAQAAATKAAGTSAGIIATIDGVLGDAALDNATGFWSWTQGIPGTDQYRFGTRVRQLQGQAFLQAFESLKGGGAITEIEGAKAEAAIGRLDSSQSAQDYRDALNELRDILVSARERAMGGTQGAVELSLDDMLNQYAPE